MCVKVTHRELREDPRTGKLDQGMFYEKFRQEVVRRVAGIQVRTMYNNKTYRVDDIDFR